MRGEVQLAGVRWNTQQASHERAERMGRKEVFLQGLVVVAMTAALFCLSYHRGAVMTDQVRALEARAWDHYQTGRHEQALRDCLELQGIDPYNARRAYIMGLVARANGEGGLPLIREAARLGDGMAASFLEHEGKRCATSTMTASTGGKSPATAP
jgi:hypothetical protein